MKNTIWILVVLAIGSALVGCNSAPAESSTAAPKNKEVPADLKKSDLPPEAQQAIANRMGSLPAGAMKPKVGDDGKVGTAPGSADKPK